MEPFEQLALPLAWDPRGEWDYELFTCPVCGSKTPPSWQFWKRPDPLSSRVSAGGIPCHRCSPTVAAHKLARAEDESTWESPELAGSDLLSDRDRVLRHRYFRHQYLTPADTRRRSRDLDRWSGPSRYVETLGCLEAWLDNHEPSSIVTLRTSTGRLDSALRRDAVRHRSGPSQLTMEARRRKLTSWFWQWSDMLACRHAPADCPARGHRHLQYIMALESGSEGWLHAHALLWNTASLDAAVLANTWLKVTRTKYYHTQEAPGSDPALVSPYRRGGGAASYVVKAWATDSDLVTFSPGFRLPSTPNTA